MKNSVNLDVNSVLSWLNLDVKNDSEETKYVNKVENVSLKWDNLNITVTTRRAFKDYVYWFFFFILRCIVISLIPLYLISLFWLNFTNSIGNIKNNLGGNVSNSVELTDSLFQKTKSVTDYFWLMDELLGS